MTRRIRAAAKAPASPERRLYLLPDLGRPAMMTPEEYSKYIRSHLVAHRVCDAITVVLLVAAVVACWWFS